MPLGEWRRLLGLDRSCEPDTLRRKLGELAGERGRRPSLARAAGVRQWVSEAADDAATAVCRRARAGVPRPGEPAEALRDVGPAEAAGGRRLLERMRWEASRCCAGTSRRIPGMVAELRSAIVPQLEEIGLLEPCLAERGSMSRA